MSRPVVTVCIATHDQCEYIETCVRSVAEQVVDADLRVLVGDDASDDGTGSVLARLTDEFAGIVKHIRRPRRLGALSNMRDLLLNADGDFLATVDGDDYWLPGKLARQITYLQEHPDCTAVYTNAITVDASGRRIGVFNDVGDERFNLAKLLRRGNFLNSSSAVFTPVGKGAVLETPRQIDYRVHLWHARHGWLGHIGEPLTAYRVSSQGSMVAGMNDLVRELYWEAIQSVPRDLVTDDDYAHGIADFLRRVSLRAFRTRDWRLMRKWGTCVFAASPYGAPRTAALTTGSIIRILGKALVGRLRKGPDRQRLRVLYRR
jgi:glycosyltransferase involved in cell wall biosynthesis